VDAQEAGVTGRSGPAFSREAIRVFLVDDHRLFLAGVRSELGSSVAMVGQATDVVSAIERIRDVEPDVVLLDVHMPEGGGLAVIEAIGRTNPEVRFLALSVSDAAEDVIAVIRAGARGHGGDAVFSPRLAGFVLDAFSGVATGSVDPELDQLTPREREVLRLIARGYAYKQIARELHISVKTVETHVSAVLRKLQLSSRYELTRWAADRNLL
jgi:DNA-binding NarL/FixJ family response regulator